MYPFWDVENLLGLNLRHYDVALYASYDITTSEIQKQYSHSLKKEFNLKTRIYHKNNTNSTFFCLKNIRRCNLRPAVVCGVYLGYSHTDVVTWANIIKAHSHRRTPGNVPNSAMCTYPTGDSYGLFILS